MAPPPDDYYLILEVEETASLDEIKKSWRRLALELHPDQSKNTNKTDTKAAFQKLREAYDTLKEPYKRQTYDVNLSTLRSDRFWSKPASQPPKPTPEPLSEAAQIVIIEQSMRERGARWKSKNASFGELFATHRGHILVLKKKISELESIAKAEKATEEWNKGWTKWVVSPLYKERDYSEEEIAQKDRAKQERRLEKDMKERRLATEEAEMWKDVDELEKARQLRVAADECDNGKIRALQAKVQARVERKRQAREAEERNARLRAEAVRRAILKRQEQEKWRRRQEKAEALRREQQAEAEAEHRHRVAERERSRQQQQRIAEQERAESQRRYNACGHHAWWPKVEGLRECPQCHDVWNYLLQCPGCAISACPKCQADIRPRTAWTGINSRANRGIHELFRSPTLPF